MQNNPLNDFRKKVCVKQADIPSLAALIIKDEKAMSAALARVDTEARFEKIFEQYYNLLNHKSMVILENPDS
jgi:hypothetical protein